MRKASLPQNNRRCCSSYLDHYLSFLGVGVVILQILELAPKVHILNFEDGDAYLRGVFIKGVGWGGGAYLIFPIL